VESERCLKCHGPVEKLAARTANKEFPKRNAHASHYGSDIACTTCHHAHEASVVMCADCHKLWKMDVPGAAQ
jgi:fumarate reductase flavoprotein subunit